MKVLSYLEIMNPTQLDDDLKSVSKRAFSYNQKVTYMGKQYYFKEQVENEILIANMETTNCPEIYNAWWVDFKHVY